MKTIISTNPPYSNALALSAMRACDHAESAKGAALGTYTKSSTKTVTFKTPDPLKLVALRADRYRLQNSARMLFLAEHRMSNGNESVISIDDYNKLHRVVKCTRTKSDFEVGIHRSSDTGKCFYSGLAVCGSVWCCPVCSAKIQERRRDEISNGINWAYENGKTCSMITLTIPHYHNQSCSDLLEKQKKALATFRSDGTWSRKMKSYGFEGLIRSLEVTHGKNGWHPHTHEIWITDSNIDRKEFYSFLLMRWEKACRKHGIIPKGKLKSFREHSIDIHFNASTSDYLAKQDDESNLSYWGADREVASGRSKSSKGNHPFQLLDAFSKGDLSKGALFLEYAKAFKGKRQIFWTHGLKKKVNIDDIDDLKLAEREDDKAVILTALNSYAWQVVLDFDFRAGILFLAESEGVNGVDSWLKSKGVDLFTDTYRNFKLRENESSISSDFISLDDIVLDFIR